MSLADRLAQIAGASESQENFLTDGRITCPYPEIPSLLKTIDRHLSAHGVRENDCLAVECRNSVPGAVLLMTLLQKGYGFALLPPSEHMDQASDLKPVPKFCRYRLIVNAVRREDEADWANHPEHFLRIQPCIPEGGEDCPAASLKTRGRLFLRTSGSMGAAKIVVHSHENLLGNAENCVRKYQFTAEDRAVIPVPIFHMYGFGAEFLPAVLVGASIDLQGHSNLLRYLDRERRFHPTIAFVTPNLCEMLLQGWKSPRAYKVVVTSGQRIKEDVFRAFDPLCGHRLVNQYGSTEMGATAACDPEEPLDIKARTIGQPMGGVQLRVGGPDQDMLGALHCRHPFGYLGYVDEAGNWISRAEEWYCTGDIARIGEHGRIEVVGRSDNCINRSGYLVLLTDIERAMERLESVTQVAITATRAENIQGQKIIAFCVAKPGCRASASEIRMASAVVLPKYAVPDEVRLLDSLPTLPSGKVDQQALVALGETQGAGTIL